MNDVHKTKLKISPQAAVFLKKEISREEKMKAARGEIPLGPSDLVSLLLYLSRDQDTELRKLSVKSLKEMDDTVLAAVCTEPDIHPVILDVLARLHHANATVAQQIARHSNTDKDTLAFLAGHEIENAKRRLGAAKITNADSPNSGSGNNKEVKPATSESEEEEENEEFKNKFQISQTLGVKEKIKLAFTGDKEWRMMLIRDNNKLVSEAVIKNPRITEQEILLICKSTVKNDDIIRTICANKDWTKNAQIRKALIENSKTPLHYALAFLSYLGEKDLSFLSKSKNISSVIVTQARRMLFNKKYGK